jgi:hypothetical protein
MGWIASFFVAALTAIVALIASATVSNLLVGWYRISSFEGGAGYFVIGNALLGFLVGGVFGLVVARVTAARPRPGLAKALGVAAGTIVTLAALVGGAARLLADIPPEIDGERLFLQTELRWPAAGAAAPVRTPGLGVVRLGALSGAIVRVQEDGPLFLEDARAIEGRWIVPGAVRIFTSRGSRIVQFRAGETMLAAFMAPLPAHPSDESRTWSAWLPAARPGSPALPDQYTFRYRVVRQSEALRTDAAGSFQIETAVRSLGRVVGAEGFAADSRFRILHRGAPVAGLTDVDSVAVLGGPQASLLVHAIDADENAECRIVTDEGQRPKVVVAGPCTAPIAGRPLTSDATRFRNAAHASVLPGWIDRVTFATPGLYRVAQMVIDTRRLAVSRFALPSDPSPVPSIPPLGVSPDERSFVWFALDGSEDRPKLGVTDIRTSRSYMLAIDRARMRYNTFEALDPAWVLHHFAWQRNAEDVDVLVERTHFAPLPYRGELTLKKAGEYQSYTLRPGAEPLRAMVVNVLTSALGGERLPDELDGYKQRVRLEGEELEVTVGQSPSYVAVSTYKGDPDLMRRIGARIDAALVTGQHDALFVPPAPSTSPD